MPWWAVLPRCCADVSRAPPPLPAALLQLKTSPKAKAMFKGMEEGSFWGFVLKS